MVLWRRRGSNRNPVPSDCDRWTNCGRCTIPNEATTGTTGAVPMPLHDHFQPPLANVYPWDGLHSAWATSIAGDLNQNVLPAGYYAVPLVSMGKEVEIDVAGYEKSAPAPRETGCASTATWAPPRPGLEVPVDFTGLDLFEVQVARRGGRPHLWAAVELISPGNKNRPAHRQAFAVKCASYLQRGVSVVIVDVVTRRECYLVASLLDVLRLNGAPPWSAPTQLYAVAY